jgi:chemotaxis protein MotB
MSENLQPIIIIEKKVNHAGHHGGAWKVAYADFVTAMMALFIVLWLLNSSIQVRKAVSAYFQDPSGTGDHSGSAAAGTGEMLSVNKDNMTELKEKLEQALKRSPEFEKFKDYVNMTVTGEGLRIEMIESEGGIFFQSGKAIPTEFGGEMIVRLTDELKNLPNDLMIEGHTDAQPFANGGQYSNWELSTDRANTARRVEGSRWTAARARGASTRVCRPTAPQQRRTGKCIKPANYDDRALSERHESRRSA